jgi:hypothetical protein
MKRSTVILLGTLAASLIGTAVASIMWPPLFEFFAGLLDTSPFYIKLGLWLVLWAAMYSGALSAAANQSTVDK